MAYRKRRSFGKKRYGKKRSMRKSGFGKKTHPLNRPRVSRGGYQN